MAKFLIEVEEGKTPNCDSCPFSFYDVGDYDNFPYCRWTFNGEISCKKYNLTTLKITKQE